MDPTGVFADISRLIEADYPDTGVVAELIGQDPELLGVGLRTPVGLRISVLPLDFFDEIRVLVGEYTFDSIPAASLIDFVREILDSRARVKVTGWLIKWAWLSVDLKGEVFQASRRLRGDLLTWERDLSTAAHG